MGEGFPKRKIEDDPDLAVDAIVRNSQQRQAARSKSRRAARQARIDAERNTRKIDLPSELETHLEQIAAQLSVPFSQLAARLMWEGLEHLTMEQLKSEVKPGRSMRYLNALPYPGKRKSK